MVTTVPWNDWYAQGSGCCVKITDSQGTHAENQMTWGTHILNCSLGGLGQAGAQCRLLSCCWGGQTVNTPSAKVALQHPCQQVTGEHTHGITRVRSYPTPPQHRRNQRSVHLTYTEGNRSRPYPNVYWRVHAMALYTVWVVIDHRPKWHTHTHNMVKT